MTTHETDRPADYDSDEENEEEIRAETEPVDADEADEPAEAEPAEAELADEPDRDRVAAHRTPESDALQKIAPVGPDAAMDPGAGSYQDRWGAIQAGFIDDPRRTVESAGALLAEIWDETVRAIADEREGVDDRWQSTESSTDDLRAVMQDYRDLYTRFMRFSSN